ncbi:cytochrome b [Caulobacter sp. CCUG 60055]|uniref:YceI family protein n=1 Tax=Caulobacter sp. CCUG 60055 TaxID=2100090 RepID=UPI001FA79B2A|nr:YceI family protein [Caulobacter sp. CCUG 60055]MCI3181296.1 cytochrome b [Caulobacter sp. CCUG 60055]
MTAASAPARSAGRYSTVAITLHWVIAAALIFQIILGWRMGDGPKGPATYALFQLHKSVGITILILTLARLGWRLGHKPPPMAEHLAGWERALARAVHVLFYVILLGLPLTGWVIVSASKTNIPTLLYGVIPWPHIPGLPELAAGPKHAWHNAGELGHGLLVKLTYGLLALHVAGALKHQLFDRDADLARMAPGTRPGAWLDPRLLAIVAGVAAVIGLGYLFKPAVKPAAPPPAPIAAEPALAALPAPDAAAAASPAAPPATDDKVAQDKAAEDKAAKPASPSKWAVAKGSALGFSTSWSGAAVEGRFDRWSADILFSPDALDQSSVTVSVDVASASTGDSQRDSTLPTEDWFDAAGHPKATFTAKTFRKTGPDRYEARGTLSLRGVSRPAALPFTLKIDGDKARMTGVTTLDRTAFGVGQGEWKATDQIPAAVKVSVSLTATRQ